MTVRMPHKPLHSCRNRSAVRAAVLFACVCIASSQSQVRSLNVVATDQQGLPVTDLVAAHFRFSMMENLSRRFNLQEALSVPQPIWPLKTTESPTNFPDEANRERAKKVPKVHTRFE
jgi:hypothetical protein